MPNAFTSLGAARLGETRQQEQWHRREPAAGSLQAQRERVEDTDMTGLSPKTSAGPQLCNEALPACPGQPLVLHSRRHGPSPPPSQLQGKLGGSRAPTELTHQSSEPFPPPGPLPASLPLDLPPSLLFMPSMVLGPHDLGPPSWALQPGSVLSECPHQREAFPTSQSDRPPSAQTPPPPALVFYTPFPYLTLHVNRFICLYLRPAQGSRHLGRARALVPSNWFPTP